MSMPADFVSVVMAQAAVTAIVGDRIYPQMIPPQALAEESLRPCLVYSTTMVDRDETFCATTELKSERIQLDCCALTYDGAKSLADAVAAGIIDWSGVSGGTQIQRIFCEGEYDAMDPDPGIYRRSLILVVWHRST